ncbi:MAG: hypothetical protein JXR76_05975 [Deltaproteobacteria bacterium]|nr:hypothetical protein [Deltaproteobacteria bacterium]
MKRVFLLCGLAVLVATGLGCSGKKDDAKKGDAAAKKVETPRQGLLKNIPPISSETPISQESRIAGVKLYHAAVKSKRDGKREDARDLFIDVLDRNPMDLNARYQLAVTLAEMKKRDDALLVLKEFKTAKACPECYLMLAKAKDNGVFRKRLGGKKEFALLVDDAAARFKKEMASANWIGFEEAALEENEVKLRIQGLPAVSDDGKQIATVYTGQDQAGKLLSATLQILDAQTGERRQSKRILFRTEGERIAAGKMASGEVAQLLAGRIALVHRELIPFKWIPFEAAPAEKLKTKVCGDNQKVMVDGKTVSLGDGHLKITGEKDKLLAKQRLEEMLPKGGDDCATHVVLKEVFVARSQKTMLFQLGFCSDTCASSTMKWTAATY